MHCCAFGDMLQHHMIHYDIMGYTMTSRDTLWHHGIHYDITGYTMTACGHLIK